MARPERNVAAATQNQALAALLFLYKAVLERDLPWFDDLVRAKRPVRLPVVQECLMLRVKDVDFAYRQVLVRDGKGAKDRTSRRP